LTVFTAEPDSKKGDERSLWELGDNPEQLDWDSRARPSGVSGLRVRDPDPNSEPPAESPPPGSDASRAYSGFHPRRADSSPPESSPGGLVGSARRLVRRLSPAGEGASPYTPIATSEWQSVFAVLAAVDELSTFTEVEAMLRRAVEIAVERFGLQRASLYVSDPPAGRRHILRGTWSAGVNQEHADERGLYLELTETDYELLRGLRGEGPRWLYSESSLRVSECDWQVVTPLLSGEQLVGVLFNDGGSGRVPMEEARQVQALLFCNLLAGLILPRRGAAVWHALRGAAGHSPVVQRVMDALAGQPKVSAQRLARDLGISSGHLARLFRTEMGISLVEYRNRLRIERFLSLADRSGVNLLDAALEAGFGSYAQFHRVFRKLVGTTPREYVAGVRLPASLSERKSRRPPASE
jgi:AraC-like DNA-binding protein